jgi:hypothetical protein
MEKEKHVVSKKKNHTLIVLGVGGIKSAYEYIQTSPHGITLLEVEECFSQKLLRPGISIKGVMDYLSSDELRQVNHYAGYLCRNWYKYNGNDATVWRGVSQGHVAEFHLYNYFLNLLHSITLAKRSLELEVPAQVVFCGSESPLEKGFKYMAEYLGIPFVGLRPNLYCDSLKSDLFPVLGKAVTRLKRERMGFLKYGLRLMLGSVRTNLEKWLWHHLPVVQNAVLVLRRRQRQQWRKNHTVIMITPHHALNGLIEGLRRDERFRVETLDRQKVRSLDWIRLNYLMPREWQRIRALEIERRQYFSHMWSSMSADAAFRDLFMINGLPLWKLMQDKLQTVYTSNFSRGVSIIEAQNIMLDVEQPHLVAFVMPFGIGQKTFAYLASSRDGTKAAVYPEAIKIEANFEMPFASQVDFLLAWGSASVAAFRGHGFSEKQITILGHQRQPPLSHNAQKGLKRVLALRKQHEGRRLIVYFDSTPWRLYFGLTQRLMETICRLMKELPKYDLAIRPHPRLESAMSDVTYEKRFSFVKELNLPNVFVTESQQESIEDIIQATDLGITLGSTVIYELLEANKPVLVPSLLPWNAELHKEFNSGPESESIDPNLESVLFTANSPDEMVSTIRYILEHPEAWDSKQWARRRFLEGQIESEVDPAEVLLQLAHTIKVGCRK